MGASYQSTQQSAPDQRLWIAIALATALHAALILGVGFDAGGERQYSPQIAVTLAKRPSAEHPLEARVMAQADQQGSGDLAQRNEVSNREQTLMHSDLLTQQSLRASQIPPQARPGQATLLTQSQAQRSAQREEQTPEQIAPIPSLSPEVNQINRQLAGLEAALEEQQRAYSNMPRVKRLTSVATQQSVDAAYLYDWRKRVEAVGNRYYPEASVRYGIYGDLRLLVVIRHDGSLEDIQVLSSSGYAVLDEAAIKIVRMAAPYAPFPAALRAEADKLEIIRTWQFQENQLSSN